jgi:tetratricopeptide (TPR) repeat protein
MKRPQLISPGSLKRLLQSAQESWKRRDFQPYFEAMERASKSDPANHRILLDLGLAYGMRYEYAGAERCLEKAVRVAPNKSEALVMAGTHCRNFNQYEMARRFFERAVEQPGVTAETMVKLGELCERLRLPDQAGKLVDRALQMDGRCGLALLVRARLDRAAGRLEQAEKLIRPMLADSDPQTWSTRIRGWYELGAILDREERYNEAMAEFLEAKALIRPNATRFLSSQQSVRTQVKDAKADITSEVLSRWSEAGASLQPARRLALLCGHPRSGTTLLEQVLDSHPEIVSAEETPVFFETYLDLKRGFPDDARMLSVLESASPALLREARASYARCVESLLGRPLGEKLLVDKNPSLTLLIPAVVRVFPETKFLAALRDPRDVCLSFFMQPLPLNVASASYLTLEGTIEEYTVLMGIWRAMAARMPNPSIEVRYEDMVADLETVARKALQFLGVAWDPRVLRFDEHARQKLVRSPTYADVAKPISSGAIGRWRNYQKHLEPWLRKLEPFVKAFGYE